MSDRGVEAAVASAGRVHRDAVWRGVGSDGGAGSGARGAAMVVMLPLNVVGAGVGRVEQEVSSAVAMKLTAAVAGGAVASENVGWWRRRRREGDESGGGNVLGG